MDILEEYYEKYIITKERVLQEVDEWLLYVFYLDFIPDLTTRQNYRSPIREVDTNPSFSIFENNRSKREVQYLWKDSALDINGDIFDLLCRMFSKELSEILQMISADFAILEDSKEVIVKRIESKPNKTGTRIRIKSKPFTEEAWKFWNSYYVSKEDLEFNKVQLVDYVWYNDSQETPFKVRDLMFAYPEFNLETNRWHYQLYCPYSKEFKFRNDLLENQIFSWNNLRFCKKSKLIITKSKKDIVCINSFGIQAGASRSETTRIKRKTMLLLIDSYEEVILLFDNDAAGIAASKEYEEYDVRIEFIPIESRCKDFSDYLKANGRIKAKELLNKLLYE